ncbi:type III pantothenate kinase [Nitrincola sp.]|uniref:type III pantothenate kinase n=1 Tax=Nitrincola sp. TaxID=1926584 RepID=UPI003A93081B
MKQLEIDAGNTFVKWRLRSDHQVVQQGRLQTSQVRDGSAVIPSGWKFAEHAWAASVAGDAVNGWLNAVLADLGVRVSFAQVSAHRYGLKNAYENPQQMGVDRWVAMLAAWQQTRQGVCVVDAGSAVTVDFVDAQGQHLGGYILPGLRLLQESLLGSTAGVRWSKLPDDYSLQPGHSTAACVYNGGHYLLAALLQRVKVDCEGYGIDHVILTGGDAVELYRHSPIGQLQESLVLDGLQWLGES